jgi:hypothetical protein|tara:strand:+ start:7422 stop:7946 length:525 start_codon:yes stop_codon:yes gene_type:complete
MKYNRIFKNLPIYCVENFLKNDNTINESITHSIEHFNANRNLLQFGYNMPINTKVGVFNTLNKKFVDLLKKFDGKDYTIGRDESMYYLMVCNEDYCPINWHNHSMTSNMVGVYYLEVPDDMTGGHILFEEREKVYKYLPKKNNLIFFPNFVNHTTTYIERKDFRISINMEAIRK